MLSARANSAIVPTFQGGVHSYGSTGALGSSRLLVETGDSVVADLIAKQLSLSYSKCRSESNMMLREEIALTYKQAVSSQFQLHPSKPATDTS